MNESMTRSPAPPSDSTSHKDSVDIRISQDCSAPPRVVEPDFSETSRPEDSEFG